MTIWEFLNLEVGEIIQIENPNQDKFFLVVSKSEDGILIAKFVSDPKELKKTHLVVKDDDIEILKIDSLEIN